MSAVDDTLATARQEWLEDRGCSETEVEAGELGEFVMVAHEGGLRKEYLPAVLQTGADPEAVLDAEGLEDVDG